MPRDPSLKVCRWLRVNTSESSLGDHLGFEVVYVFDGVVRKYRPDFLVRLDSGTMLVLEVKGQDSAQNVAKRAALDEWARAVTAHGGFGRWTWAVSRTPSDVADLIQTTAQSR